MARGVVCNLRLIVLLEYKLYLAFIYESVDESCSELDIIPYISIVYSEKVRILVSDGEVAR